MVYWVNEDDFIWKSATYLGIILQGHYSPLQSDISDISSTLHINLLKLVRSPHLILDVDATLAVQGVGDVDREGPGIAILAVGAGVAHVDCVILRVVDGRGEEGLAEAFQSAVQRILAIILSGSVHYFKEQLTQLNIK